MTVSSLRAHLLDALLAIPGSRKFHLHVLVSTTRKPGQSLFLYADTRPKCLVQDVLILLSEETTKPAETDTSINSSLSEASINLAPRVFVSAIEASVYAFPASKSTILYISKVDGTGQGAYPSPTSTLLRAFLVFYASPQSPLYARPTVPHNLWIHLFARSQRQYLFPNSADHPNKRPLADVALCRWWKNILSNVVKAVETIDDKMLANDARFEEEKTHRIRLYYILPGQTQSEALYLLRDAPGSSSPPQTPWIYSHPYDVHADARIPFPSGATPGLTGHLGEIPRLAYLIPHFEDDPKSRFLDELAATSEEQPIAVPIPTPRTKRQKTRDGTDITDSTVAFKEIEEPVQVGSSTIADEKGANVDTTKIPFEQPPLAPAIIYIPPSSSPREETPPHSLRPSTPGHAEIPQSAILSPSFPTFPVSSLSPHTPLNEGTSSDHVGIPQTPSPRTLLRTPQMLRTPRRPTSDLDTISPSEFWERMSFRQECALGAVTGFFVAVFLRNATVSQNDYGQTLHLSPSTIEGTKSSVTSELPSTLLSTGTLPHSVLKRIVSSLLTGVEFSTSEWAQQGTSVMEGAIQGLCQGLSEGNSSTDERVNRPKTTDVGVDSDARNMTPNLYTSHIYGSLSTSNPPLARKSGDSAGRTAAGVTPVNVLGVRRKKKRE